MWGRQPSAIYATTVPHLAFMIFSGDVRHHHRGPDYRRVVERMKFSALMVFAGLWLTLVYLPVAHWVWGSGGWLAKLGALDFAGGTVVHINAGVSALALAWSAGPSEGLSRRIPWSQQYPHGSARRRAALVRLVRF